MQPIIVVLIFTWMMVVGFGHQVEEAAAKAQNIETKGAVVMWSNALNQAYQRYHGRRMEIVEPYQLYIYIAAGAVLALGLLAAVWGIRKLTPVPMDLELRIREPQDEQQMTTNRASNLSQLKNRRDGCRRAGAE